ncbi:UNVERIFIED_CONTAM: hypothetical protein HDU68_007142 [Siphonaria sp. JEL0065]|nr:hypothetical protein HDU68_007142 [Siphonaria sp. JEL0065]
MLWNALSSANKKRVQQMPKTGSSPIHQTLQKKAQTETESPKSPSSSWKVPLPQPNSHAMTVLSLSVSQTSNTSTRHRSHGKKSQSQSKPGNSQSSCSASSLRLAIAALPHLVLPKQNSVTTIPKSPILSLAKNSFSISLPLILEAPPATATTASSSTPRRQQQNGPLFGIHSSSPARVASIPHSPAITSSSHSRHGSNAQQILQARAAENTRLYDEASNVNGVNPNLHFDQEGGEVNMDGIVPGFH